MTEFFEPSAKAKEAAKEPVASRYPWSTVPVGMSFAIPKGRMNLKTLKPHAARMGKKHNKLFVVTEHPTAYEVYCKPQSDDNAG